MWELKIMVPPCGYLNLNKVSSMHWRTKSAATKAWRLASYVAARDAGLPKNVGKIRVETTLHFVDRRTRDPENYALTIKPIIDGLGPQRVYTSNGRLVVEPGWGFIVGDDPRFLEKPETVIGPPRRPPYVVLTITQLDQGE